MERRSEGAAALALPSALLQQLVVLLALLLLLLLDDEEHSRALAAATGDRCDLAPCSCDQWGRLTCDCKGADELLELSREGPHPLGGHLSRIVVRDCPRVLVRNASLEHLGSLSSLELADIANLTLEHQGFRLSKEAAQVRIALRNASLATLPGSLFHGDVEAIELEQVRVGRVEAFAFANILNTETVALKHCELGALDAHAFKQFGVKYLQFIGGSLAPDGELPSYAVNNLEVANQLLLEGVRLGAVRSSAFIVRGPKTLVVSDCRFAALDAQALDVQVHGAVVLKNNQIGSLGFGALLSIRGPDGPTNSGGHRHSLIFKNNSVARLEEGSLLFDRAHFRLELDQLTIRQPCDCGQLPTWRAQILNQSLAYARLRQQDDRLDSQLTLPQPEELAPGAFLCLVEGPPGGGGGALSLPSFEAEHCQRSGSGVLLASLLSGLAAGLLALGVLLVCLWRRRAPGGGTGRHSSATTAGQEQRWLSVPTQAPDLVGSEANSKPKKNGVIGGAGGGLAGKKKGKEPPTSVTPVDSRITMVVPDGRLYRETEFHVIVEKAEPLTTEL